MELENDLLFEVTELVKCIYNFFELMAYSHNKNLNKRDVRLNLCK